MLLAVEGPGAYAYPEPDIVSPSWSLEFTFENPAPIVVRDARGQLTWYWYMTYQVVNRTGEDRMFIPECTIAEDDGRIITAGQGVPPGVFTQIKAQLGNPLLESPIEVVGKILQGIDYAKQSVAIWPCPLNDVDEFSVFIAGLSGETATIQNPITDEDVLMRRSVMLQFSTPGNNTRPQVQPVVLSDRRDVMR